MVPSTASLKRAFTVKKRGVAGRRKVLAAVGCVTSRRRRCVHPDPLERGRRLQTQVLKSGKKHFFTPIPRTYTSLSLDGVAM